MALAISSTAIMSLADFSDAVAAKTLHRPNEADAFA